MKLTKHYAPLMIPVHLHDCPVQKEFECYIASEVDALSEWQPIEIAPRDGSFILAWPVPTFVNGERVNVWSAVRRNLGGWVVVRSGYSAKPTHWMSMPEPPK